MAYIKYKELTKYFYFNKRMDEKDLPSYVTDYLYKDEKIIGAYKTRRDRAVFTNERMVLFDVTPFTKKKKIHILPYKSISTSAISYSLNKSEILIAFDSGYQLRLIFTNMSASDKRDLRLLFYEIMRDQR